VVCGVASCRDVWCVILSDDDVALCVVCVVCYIEMDHLLLVHANVIEFPLRASPVPLPCLSASLRFSLRYRWPCGGIGSLGDWLKRADVRTALHFGAVNPVRFDYSTSGPASIVLWPSLVKQLRVLIYNGDADDCVPYHGNEEWTTNLADQGMLKEKKAWHPWYKTAGKGIPAGYATTYDVREMNDVTGLVHVDTEHDTRVLFYTPLNRMRGPVQLRQSD